MGRRPVPAPEAFPALAALLEYPGEGFPARARAARQTLHEAAPACAKALAAFFDRAETAAGADGAALEETYALTFDWNPDRCLEVGWHLYGEQYDRGAFLVRMRERLREAGIDEGTELPDHLAAALRLVGRLPPQDAAAFAGDALLPALERVVAGFSDRTDNPYAAVVRCVHDALQAIPGARERRAEAVAKAAARGGPVVSPRNSADSPGVR